MGGKQLWDKGKDNDDRFPSAYPGHEDGEDTALNAETELAMREHWDDPEMRGALIDDGYVVPTELPDLTLPDAVDLMLRAYWKPDSKLHKSLEAGDFLHAATLVRNYDNAPTRSRWRRSLSSLAASRPSWSVGQGSLRRHEQAPARLL